MKLEIKNKDDIKNIIEKCKVKTDKGDFVFFTNGNSWYIETLIKNLLISIDKHDKKYNNIIVFCTDKDGYKKCEEHNFNFFEYVDIPELKVSELLENKNIEHYTRLTFVKIVLISYILELGYIPFYLDPDMSFKRESIDDLINYLDDETEFICSGNIQHMNSNIMIVKPSINTKKMFNVYSENVDYIISRNDLYSDEDYLRPYMLDTKINNKIKYISQIEYPPGCHAKKYINELRIVHANCAEGLKNKVELLKNCGVWYI